MPSDYSAVRSRLREGGRAEASPSSPQRSSPNGTPIHIGHSYTYRDGAHTYSLGYNYEKTILRDLFIDQVHGVKKLLAKAVGFDGAYLRFSGTLDLTETEKGLVVNDLHDPAIWELMYFGKDRHEAI